MRTIFKYPLNYGETNVMVTECSKILHFAEQRGTLCVWIEVQKDKPLTSERKLVIHGTGHDVEAEETHLMSCFELGGDLVWHLYEVHDGN